MTDEFRRELVQRQIDRVLGELRRAGITDPRNIPRLPMNHEEATAYLGTLDYVGKPVRLSPEALAQFGIREEIEEPVSEGDPQ